MRHDAALYLPYTGAYAGRGAHRKYGDKLNMDQLPESALKATCCEGESVTEFAPRSITGHNRPHLTDADMKF